eukprot:CAMPEP_0178714140 /NCGR_PEP_ID=MMETSP0699-20121125/19874_1 /TAXON_ID=265572 /ORGANISM="Extubocellulus spinifer, Strain CCMP396" /LENGTH=337 /DNA_ID=CAMNT_0020363173 /DNA_START=39 /DNA_END=1052 /DNA_ORIENTATION=+
MPPPTIIARFRQVLGRALRETGQAVDRAGVWGITQANTTKTLGDPPYIYDDHLSRHRNQMPLLRRGMPQVSDDVAYIAPCSTLIGTVRIGPGSSVWYGSVLRADRCNNGMGRSPDEEVAWRALSKNERSSQRDLSWDGTANGGGIYIGADTNVQDGCVVTAVEDHTTIGDGVTIGHGAHIHSATVEDHSLIGMGAILSPGSKVESQSFVAAGAVIGRDVTVPSGELWVGNPARKLRNLTQPEMDKLKYQADEYVKQAMGQSNVMDLGGNVADELAPELEAGRTDLSSESQGGVHVEQEEVSGTQQATFKRERSESEDINDDDKYSDEEAEPLKVRAQ